MSQFLRTQHIEILIFVQLESRGQKLQNGELYTYA